jgi:aryl-alcohol dehydrogenase-like predicted oxidoreductase
MRLRTLGKTGIEIPELCLGTWGLSGDGYGHVDEADQNTVIERALALGVTAFDTSDSYARGEMETRLGRLLEPHAEAIVLTKIGTDRSVTQPVKRFDAEYLESAAQKSRERLKRKIDVLLLHNPSSVALEKPHVAEALARLVEQGVAKAWGVSIGNAEVGKAAIERGAQVLELAYSAFHPQDLAGRAGASQREAGRARRAVGAFARTLVWPMAEHQAIPDHRSPARSLDRR